jgi:predicted transposase YdaD
VEGRGEVCLAEEAERLRRSGLEIDEVARRMGVDAAWVETVVAEPEGDEEPTPEKG